MVFQQAVKTQQRFLSLPKIAKTRKNMFDLAYTFILQI